MRANLLSAVVAAAVLASSGALAAEEKPGRYTMTPTEGGALKLDTLSGAVSFCTRADGDWACKPTKDGEAVLRREMEGLRGEIDVLKDQLTKMEEIAGIGDPNKAGQRPGAGPQASLPTEKDVDQAFDYFEKMVKKLRERLNKLEGNEKKGTPL